MTPISEAFGSIRPPLSPAECDRRIRRLMRRSLELSQDAARAVARGPSQQGLEELKTVQTESEAVQREINVLKAAIQT